MSPKLKAALVGVGLGALTLVGVFAPVRSPSANAMTPVASVMLAASESPPPVVASAAPPATSAAPTTEAAPASETGTLADGRVVLNLATEDDLEKLPGIGPTRAKAILALRQKLGKFRAVSELLRVKGLGRKSLARLAPKLVLDPPKPPTV